MAKGFYTLNIYPETGDLIRSIAKLEQRQIATVVEEMAIRYSELLTTASEVSN